MSIARPTDRVMSNDVKYDPYINPGADPGFGSGGKTSAKGAKME